MSRSYKHIKEYEKEILEMKSQGVTLRAIGERLEFTYKQVHNFITKYNTDQRKIAAWIALRKKGRPPKDYVVSEQSKVAELKSLPAKAQRVSRWKWRMHSCGISSRSSKGSEDKRKIYGDLPSQG